MKSWVWVFGLVDGGQMVAVVLLVAMMGDAVWAQSALTLTPEACVEIGLAQNPTVRAARHQAEAAWSTHAEARTYRLPLLRGQGTYRRLSPNIPGFEVDLPDGVDLLPDESLTIAPVILNYYALQAQIEQPVFAGLEVTNQIRATRHAARVSQSETRATEAAIALQIRETYWRLVEAEARTEVVTAAQRQVDDQLRVVRRRLDEGMALRSDVLAIEARRSAIELERLEATSAVRSARWRLNRLLGLPADAIVTPARRTVTPVPVRASLDDLVARALRQRPQVTAASQAQAAAQARVRARQSGWMPRIALTGTYSYARPNPNIFPQTPQFDGTWEAGIRMTMDVWDWGRTGARVEQARAEVQASREVRRDVERQIRVEVAEARDAVLQAEAALTVAVRRREETREVFRILRARHAQGKALTTEVLAAEVAHREAELDGVRMEVRYATARAQLRYAVGDG